MLKPGSRRVRQEQREIADDEQIIVRATQLAGQAVIGEPKFRVGLAAVLREVGRLSEPGGERSNADGPAEDPRSWRLRGRTAVLTTVVATASVWVVASGGSVVVAPSPANYFVVALCLALVPKSIAHRGGPVDRRCASGLGTDRGILAPARLRCGLLRSASAPAGGGTFGLLHCCGLEEVAELSADPSPFGGGGLGHRSDEYRSSCDILASAVKDWGWLSPLVVVDAVMDVAGPPSGSSALTAPSLLLLESVPELLQKESVLFDLGLKLAELLQVWASMLSVDGVLVPRCRGFETWRCGVARPCAR